MGDWVGWGGGWVGGFAVDRSVGVGGEGVTRSQHMVSVYQVFVTFL